jgi:hypothetical protein
LALGTGITVNHVKAAIAELGDRPTVPPFRMPTGYWLTYNGRHYAPKAVVGLARRLATGHPLVVDFSGGDGSSGANTVLRRLGFAVEPFQESLGGGRRRPGVPNDDWRIPLGDVRPRRAVHAEYGGAWYGGIEPSAKSSNILLFTNPDRGREFGYDYDGWDADGTYHYTGDGQRGPQLFVAGNLAVRDHRETGRALRLFRANGRDVTYIGQFELPDRDPYLIADGLDADDLPRTVIVFRLRPVGPVLSDLTDVAPAAGATRDVPLEAANVEEFQVEPPTEPEPRRRREAQLVQRYATWLRVQGHIVGGKQIRPPGELRELKVDLVDRTANELVEAKASADRDSVRMALGQLLDYRRHLKVTTAALLVPTRPRDDLLDLLKLYGISCVWEGAAGFSRADP